MAERSTSSPTLLDEDAGALLDLAHDAILILDVAGRILYWNHGAQVTYGYAREEAIGRRADELLRSSLPVPLEQILERAVDLGAWDGELIQRNKAGEKVVVASKWTVQLDREGGIERILEINRDVTAQKRAEEFFQYVMRTAHCLLWYADVEESGDRSLEWRFHLPSEEAAYRFLPLKGSEGAGFVDSWYGCRLAEDRDRSDREGCEAVRAGRDYEVEYRCQMDDGAIRWLREEVQVEVVEEGKRWRTVGICTDVTERREAEEGLRMTLQSAGVGWYGASMVHDIWVMSPEYASMLGVRVEDYTTKSAFRSLAHPEDLAVCDEVLARGLAEKLEIIDLPETRYRHADGSWRWHRATCRVTYGAGGPNWITGIGVDETRRREMEEALREGEDLLSLATEVGGVGTFHSDHKFGIVNLNPIAQRLVGLTESTVPIEEMIGLIHPEDRARVLNEIDRAKDPVAHKPFEMNFRLSQRDGGIRWVSVRGAFRFDESRKPPIALGSTGVIVDVTDAMERELALEQLVDERTSELRTSNDEMQSFVYAVAHDLKAPLRAINSTSKILLQETQDRLEHDHRHMLERQVANALKLAHLLDDLLALSRVSRQPLNPMEFSFSAVATEVAASYPSEECEIVVQPGMIAVADPAQLRLVLENLIGNAVKYSPGKALVNVGSSTEKGETVFFVSDQGIGFDIQYADRIFLPFERLHRESDIPGTGIGLASVKRIIERHGGRVWVESTPGEGSTFLFTLA